MVLVVPPAAAGVRLDVFLASAIPDLTRSQAKRLLDGGRVALQGARAKAGTTLRGGERLRVRPFPAGDETIRPDAIPLEILAQDDDMVVLVKQADLVVHPAAGHSRGTLVNALVHHGLTAGGGDPRRPGIVHRLDRGTSGVMVVARNAVAHARLAAQFRDHSVERAYLAIVQGAPPDRGRLETPFRRHPVDRKRFTSRVAAGARRRAVTSFAVLDRVPGYALVRARLGTGRTHQIRVHFSDHGFPVLGDPIYGKPPRDPLGRRAAAGLGRPALHAAVLGFRHPRTGTLVRYEAPPPADFTDAWLALGGLPRPITFGRQPATDDRRPG